MAFISPLTTNNLFKKITPANVLKKTISAVITTHTAISYTRAIYALKEWNELGCKMQTMQRMFK